MVTKWASIPFAIVVVLCAGSAVNLSPYFLELKDQLGFEPIHQSFVKWGVIFGYFGGIIAGPFVDAFNTTPSFILAAFISGGGFVGLAFYTAAENVNTFNVIVIIVLLFVVSLSCAIATIAAIATVIKNFSRNVGAMITAIMITYFLCSPWFEFTIRHGYFEDIELKVNLIAMGVILFVIFIIAAFIVDENEQSPKLKRASALTDTMGILIYASICGGFIAAIYFTCIIAEEFKLGVFAHALFILINFVALAFTISALLGKISKSDTRNAGEEVVPPKKHFGQMLGDIRYYCLLIGTFFVVGAGTAFHIQAADLAIAMGKDEDLGAKVLKAYWLSMVLASLGGGLVAAIFNRFLNAWLFAAIAAFTGMVGYGFVFLGESSDIWFYISGFLIGTSVGGWWVIVPQIILDDAGPRSFESLWGVTITFNALGLLAADGLFVLVNGKEEAGSPSTCQGTSCFMIPYIVFAGVTMIAGILAIVGFSNDEGTGGSGGERRPLKDNDANKKSGKKSSRRSGSKKGSKSRSGSKKSGRSKSKDKR
jgi:hypothetical protein